MITNLINFTLCSALMLAAYHLLLKNKAMYRFNRWYLLGSLAFSFLVPFFVWQQPIHQLVAVVNSAPSEIVLVDDLINEVSRAPQKVIATVQVHPKQYIGKAILDIYLLISLILLFRFIRNVNSIKKIIAHSKTLPYQGSQLVLITGQHTPHTFLNWIFLNRAAYGNGQIAGDILRHELAHASQLHTVDIIVVELLQAVCWFNPLLPLYSRAIRLNHEFLADEAVLKGNQQVKSYQTLLLNSLAGTPSLFITSQFNYSITKQRLLMMTKKTPASVAWVSRAAIVPLMIIASALFCNKADAIELMKAPLKVLLPKVDTVAKAPLHKVAHVGFSPLFFSGYPHSKTDAPQRLLDEYATLVKKIFFAPNPKRNIRLSDTAKNRMIEIYKQMSLEQQKHQHIGFSPYPKPSAPNTTTQAQLNQWASDSKTYGVWLNDKRIKNELLADYKPEDFSQSSISHLTPIAVKNDHFYFQVNLMTTEFYKQYLAKEKLNQGKSLAWFRPGDL